MILVLAFHSGQGIQDEIILSRNETTDTLGNGNADKLPLTNTVRKKCPLNGYLASIFASELRKSKSYQEVVSEYYSKLFKDSSRPYIRIKFIVDFPSRHFIDYKW